jgi:hypothetical protein
MKLNGLLQEGRHASNNRSLLNSLQQDSDTSGVSREGIHRRAKHTLLSVPDTERAELSDDIKFSERPPRVLSSPNAGSRLRQISDEADVVALLIRPFRHGDGELPASHVDDDRNRGAGLGHCRQDPRLIRTYETATPIDDHLRRKWRRQAQRLNVAALTLARHR